MRRLYTLLLQLHPAAFRRRYAAEMLWIFDQEKGFRSRGGLFADLCRSVGRQWLLRLRSRPTTPIDAARTDPGAPVFYTFSRSAPAVASLANGAVASVAAFALAAFLIAHGRPSGTLKLPMVIFTPSEDVPGTIEQPAAPKFRLRGGSPPVQPRSRQPAAPAPAAPRRRAAGAAPDSSVGYPALLFPLLDRDEDGVISELEKASEAAEPFRELLDLADQNRDGVVTRDEFEALPSVPLR